MHARWLTAAIPFVVAGAVSIFPVSPACGGAGEVQVEVAIMVPPLQRLEVDPPVLVMPEIQAEEIAAGYVDLPRPIMLTVSSNTPWELFVRWAGDARTDAGGGATRTPRLQWTVGSAPFQTLGADWTPLAAGSEPAAEERIALRLRLYLKADALEPGLYQPRLEYRLAGAGE